MDSINIKNETDKLTTRLELEDDLSTEQNMRKVIQVLLNEIKKHNERITKLEEIK
jgi:hypothetical protein